MDQVQVKPRVLRDDFQFKISDEAFQYLAIQKGEINTLVGERWAWERAYHDVIFTVYESMEPYLPERCSRVIDIGSGLGGIDCVLNKHFGGFVEVCPVDGEDDQPVVHRHAQTFNSEKVTRAFLNANGVSRVSYFSPKALPLSANARVIISVGSWCFHYPPGVYIEFVRRSLAPGGTLIVDCRRGKPYREMMREVFTEIAVAHQGQKYERVVFAG